MGVSSGEHRARGRAGCWAVGSGQEMNLGREDGNRSVEALASRQGGTGIRSERLTQ